MPEIFPVSQKYISPFGGKFAVLKVYMYSLLNQKLSKYLLSYKNIFYHFEAPPFSNQTIMGFNRNLGSLGSFEMSQSSIYCESYQNTSKISNVQCEN